MSLRGLSAKTCICFAAKVRHVSTRQTPHFYRCHFAYQNSGNAWVNSSPSSCGLNGFPQARVMLASSASRLAASKPAFSRSSGSLVEVASRQIERPARNPDAPALQEISTCVLKLRWLAGGTRLKTGAEKAKKRGHTLGAPSFSPYRAPFAGVPFL